MFIRLLSLSWINKECMSFIPPPMFTRHVTMCMSLMSGPYVIRHLYFGLALKGMSDSAVGNGSGSSRRAVDEHLLRPERFVCGEVGGKKNLLCLGVSCSSSGSLCTTSSCIDGWAGGAFHTPIGKVLFLRALVQWPSKLIFPELKARFGACERRECFYRMKVTFQDDLKIGYSGSFIDLCWRCSIAGKLLHESRTKPR